MGCRWWPLLLNRRTSRLIKTPWNVWKSRLAVSWPNSLKAFQTFKLALGVKTCCHRLLLAVAHWCGCRTSKWLMTIAVKSEAKAVWKTLRSVCCSKLGITVLSFFFLPVLYNTNILYSLNQEIISHRNSEVFSILILSESTSRLTEEFLLRNTVFFFHFGLFHVFLWYQENQYSCFC